MNKKTSKKPDLDVAAQNFAEDEELARGEGVKENVKLKNEEVDAMKDEDKDLKKEVAKGKEKAAEEKAKAQEGEESGDFMLAALGYIPPLFLLPLLMKKESDFCQFHGKQALAMFIVFMGYAILSWLFLNNMSLGLGFRFLLFLIRLGFVILFGFGLVTALQGKKIEVPPFSKLTESFKF